MTCCRTKSYNIFICLSVLVGWLTPFACAEIKTDFLMDSDPKLQVPEPVQKFHPDLATLWMEVLNRPEIDMQRMAAETIARAHRFNVPDLFKAVPRLEAILLADSSHPAARFAAARALIVLESHGSSEKLFGASQVYGADMRQLIEPAMAAWGNESVKTVWTERLNASETRPRDLILAIRGLGQIREQSILSDLLAIAADLGREPQFRLEAAEAAGNIADAGLEQQAERLASNIGSSHFANQLCAIRLLSHHSSQAASQLLIDLASHQEPVVAGAALQRLNEIDFSLVLPMAESAMQNTDPLVRRQGAMCMLQIPAANHIVPLCKLLGDPHPRLRRDVCEGLFRISTNVEFAELIFDASQQVLAGDGWRGQEQAALLLGALMHKPAAARLVDLLESPRMEVGIAVAWALRKVAVEETVPSLIDQATRQTERRVNNEQPVVDEQVAHLFEALGVLKADESIPLLLRYVPKHRSMRLSRGAAIWAIGRLKDGKRDLDIESALTNRILDFAPQPKETPRVKQMCAIALARMQAVEQAPMMRQYVQSDNVDQRLESALGWAVKELTGDVLPPPQPVSLGHIHWFLEPIP